MRSDASFALNRYVTPDEDLLETPVLSYSAIWLRVRTFYIGSNPNWNYAF